MNWKATWTESFLIAPLEGRRGAGGRAGQIGVAQFSPGIYPACSEHGAMVCVRRRIDRESLWRCLVEGCNVGATWRGHPTRHYLDPIPERGPYPKMNQ